MFNKRQVLNSSLSYSQPKWLNFSQILKKMFYFRGTT